MYGWLYDKCLDVVLAADPCGFTTIFFSPNLCRAGSIISSNLRRVVFSGISKPRKTGCHWFNACSNKRTSLVDMLYFNSVNDSKIHLGMSCILFCCFYCIWPFESFSRIKLPRLSYFLIHCFCEKSTQAQQYKGKGTGQRVQAHIV